jgi:hypothetical protein
MTPWDLIEQHVSQGVNYGWNRAHKHCDKPDEEQFKEKIAGCVMDSLHELLPMFVIDMAERRKAEMARGEA